MKTYFEEPKILLTLFETADVLTLSPPEEGDDEMPFSPKD